MTARAVAPGPPATAVQHAQALLGQLEQVRRSIEVQLPPDVPNLDAARERLHVGIPALAGEALLMDGRALERNLRRFLDCLSQRDDGVGNRAAALAHAVLGYAGSLPWDDLAAIALAGEWNALSDMAPLAGADHATLATLLDWAARPSLIAGSARISVLLNERRRETGPCPCCGTLPGLAELRGTKDESARVLRCLRCAAAWRWPMLACPSCRERDHRQLGYVHGEGEFEYRRAECCRTCGFYVKAVATLMPIAVDDLLRTDLASAGLDEVTSDRGYWRSA